MKNLLRFSTFFLLLSALGHACSDKEVIDPGVFDASQLAYYPLALGRVWEYRVDSILFDPAIGGGTQIDSSSTFVKEVIVDTLTDLAGEQIYLIERQERKSENEPWAFAFVCSESLSNGKAVRTEQNIRFLKLLFPMDALSFWNGNLWIDVDREIEISGERMMPFINWNYKVDAIDIPMQTGAFFFDSTLVITEADDESVVERRYSRAWYAKHVGLIKREQEILDSQYCNQTPAPADCASLPWHLKAERGYILRQTLIHFQ